MTALIYEFIFLSIRNYITIIYLPCHFQRNTMANSCPLLSIPCSKVVWETIKIENSYQWPPLVPVIWKNNTEEPWHEKREYQNQDCFTYGVLHTSVTWLSDHWWVTYYRIYSMNRWYHLYHFYADKTHALRRWGKMPNIFKYKVSLTWIGSQMAY